MARMTRLERKNDIAKIVALAGYDGLTVNEIAMRTGLIAGSSYLYSLINEMIADGLLFRISGNSKGAVSCEVMPQTYEEAKKVWIDYLNGDRAAITFEQLTTMNRHVHAAACGMRLSQQWAIATWYAAYKDARDY